MVPGAAAGSIGRLLKTAKSLKTKPKAGGVTKKAPEITKPYKRPSGATTKAQRESVQGKPCVDCGATIQKQYADHKDPLVKEYYQKYDSFLFSMILFCKYDSFLSIYIHII